MSGAATGVETGVESSADAGTGTTAHTPSLDERRRTALAASAADGALLVVDVQRSFADPEFLAEYALGEEDLDAVARAIARCAELVDSARAAGIPVVWIELASEPTSHWVASSWLLLGDADAPLLNAPCIPGTAGAQWYGLAPAPGETRVVKHRYSGFVGTDLAERLAAAGVRWVAVAGLTTECCVAATVFDAFQRDLLVVVPEDATAAYSAPLHRTTLDSLALNAAMVMPAAELASIWTNARVRP